MTRTEVRRSIGRYRQRLAIALVCVFTMMDAGLVWRNTLTWGDTIALVICTTLAAPAFWLLLAEDRPFGVSVDDWDRYTTRKGR